MVEEVSLASADSPAGSHSPTKLHQKSIVSQGILVNNLLPCSDFTLVEVNYRRYK